MYSSLIKNRRLKIVWRLLISLLLLILAIAAMSEIGPDFNYKWHWNRVWRYLGHWSSGSFIAGPFLKGIWITIAISCVGFGISILSGLAAAAFRLSAWPLCMMSAKTYIAIWRNTPLLLQLFAAYFLIAPIFKLGPFWTAAIALGLFEGAYFAEIFRAGILSVSKGQWEASLSLGLNLKQSFISVILPQAVKNILPPMAGQTVSILKDSTLVSAIAVADLTMQSQVIVAESFLAFEVWLLVAAIYLSLALFISFPAIVVEKRILSKRRTL